MITDIIKSIQNQLEIVKPHISYIDIDWGQMDLDKPPVKYPAIIINPINVSYSDLNEGIQEADMEIELRLYDIVLNHTSNIANIQRDYAYRIHDISIEIHRALHRWRPSITEVGPLTRLSMAIVNRKDGIKQVNTRWKIHYIDHSAMTEVDLLQPNIPSPIPIKINVKLPKF